MRNNDRTNIKPKKRKLPQNGIQSIIFTSPSTVRNFLDDHSSIPAHWRILSKGPLTSQALKKAGYESEVFK